jgi:hypothetical protein
MFKILKILFLLTHLQAFRPSFADKTFLEPFTILLQILKK